MNAAPATGSQYWWVCGEYSRSFTTSEAPLLTLDGPRLEVLADNWVDDRRSVIIQFTTSLHDVLHIFIPNSSLLAITFPNGERTETGVGREWMLRL